MLPGQPADRLWLYAVRARPFRHLPVGVIPDFAPRSREHMAVLLPPQTEVLGGLELGGLPIATVLSQVTGLPGVLVRARRRPYGGQRFIEGVDCTGRMVVLVDGSVSFGPELRNSVAALRQLGATLTTVVCAIDRLDVPRPVGQDAEVRVALSRCVLERVRIST